ncbi:MAG: hypothetical protein IPJ65_00055 [Archangiaceae bacterium]|nr:hypothetical protein [Archangiaceae bacterium]
MDFFKKLAGVGVFGIIPMLIAKANEAKKTEVATVATTPPVQFDNSTYTPAQRTPMTLPPPDVYGSGIDPNQPVNTIPNP